MAFFSRLCNCLLKRGGAASDDGGGGEDDTSDGGDSSNLLFDLHTLQLAANFFSDLNLLGRGGFGPVFKVTLFFPLQTKDPANRRININKIINKRVFFSSKI